MRKPLAIDLYCGLGGWSDGLLAEGWNVVGFDIEQHDYGTGGYPGQLVIQDVTTLHGSQFKGASLIVASPPCQEYSYMAMPWSRAKERARKYRAGELDVADLTRLFDACFRIQREAIEAAGHHIPLIVENVRGAVPWVSQPPRWNFGSYYLFGDVPALMPITFRGMRKTPVGSWDTTRKNYNADHSWNAVDDGQKQPGRNFHFPEKYGIPSPSFHGAEHETSVREAMALTINGASHETRGVKGVGSWFGDYQTQKKAVDEGIKQGGDWFGKQCQTSMSRRFSSKSNSRKAASAMIAKIPFPLSQHIAQVFKGDSRA